MDIYTWSDLVAQLTESSSLRGSNDIFLHVYSLHIRFDLAEVLTTAQCVCSILAVNVLTIYCPLRVNINKNKANNIQTKNNYVCIFTCCRASNPELDVAAISG